MAELNEDKLVVPADKSTANKKVKVELEVDTSAKDLGPNPYARLIHLARAIDSWRIFPRIFITTYIVLLYKCVIWYMYHITHLYKRTMYVVMNILGNILQLSIALAR